MGARKASLGNRGAGNDYTTLMGWNCIGVAQGKEIFECFCFSFDDIFMMQGISDRDIRNRHPIESSVFCPCSSLSEHLSNEQTMGSAVYKDIG